MTTEGTPLHHLSFSGASTFAQCPRQWKGVYIDGNRGGPTPQTEVGTLVHAVLEDVMGQPPGNRTFDYARERARNRFNEFLDSEEHAAIADAVDDWKAFRWTMWDAITTLWQLEDPTGVEVIALEAPVEVGLGRVPFMGAIDRVDTVGIKDYKSSRAPNPRYENKNENQILLYAAAWEALHNGLPKKASLVYLKDGGKMINIGVTRGRVDEAVGWLNAIWDGILDCINKDDFPAQPGPLCGWCPVLEDCEAGLAAVRARMKQGKNVGPGEHVALNADKMRG